MYLIIMAVALWVLFLLSIMAVALWVLFLLSPD